jgi:hypothetical protein
MENCGAQVFEVWEKIYQGLLPDSITWNKNSLTMDFSPCMDNIVLVECWVDAQGRLMEFEYHDKTKKVSSIRINGELTWLRCFENQ